VVQKLGPVFDKVTQPKWACGARARQTIAKAAAGLAAVFACSPVWAIELYRGENIELRWDNTIRYSAAFRLDDRNPALLGNRNSDDGNRNFDRGLISNRIDLFSQIDFSKDGLGIHASAAAWYDSIYNRRNDNDSPGTFNPVSVPHDAFTHEVRTLHGQQAELVDAFFYANTALNGLPFSFRVGRHTLLWGESLFFPNNGIAAGQAPVDAIKLFNQPTIYARDVFMPVAQVSGSLQLPGALALEAYYQFEWRKTRLPGAGSYFSTADFLDAGGERYFLRGNQYLIRTQDQEPPGSGQYGAALRWSSGPMDLGIYAVRYNAKNPQVYYRSGVVSGSDPPIIVDPSIVDLLIGKAGNYNLVYPRGTEIYGASVSGYLGSSNIAVEISGRRNMPLVSTLLFQPPGRPADANENPLYAVGDTLHAQLSTVTTLARSPLWDSANINAEVAAVQRLRVTKNPGAVDPESSELSAAFRGTFEPTYFEVIPNLDITMRLGLGYNFAGKSSTDFYQNRGEGDLDLGVTATYRVVWIASAMFTHFLGKADRQVLADRDFIRFSIERTF